MYCSLEIIQHKKFSSGPVVNENIVRRIFYWALFVSVRIFFLFHMAVMTFFKKKQKKKDLPDPNGDLSLVIHPTIIDLMNHKVEATSASTSTSTSTSGSVPGTSKHQPYNKYESINDSNGACGINAYGITDSAQITHL